MPFTKNDCVINLIFTGNIILLQTASPHGNNPLPLTTERQVKTAKASAPQVLTLPGQKRHFPLGGPYAVNVSNVHTFNEKLSHQVIVFL